MSADQAATMKFCHPWPGIIAFYDGRIAGHLRYSARENWLDDGAYSLGTASYAVVDGDQAVVYDTHMTLDHARFIRRTLTAAGVTSIRVVLSHWHTDHVAGNEEFADCEIIASELTCQLLVQHRQELEQNSPPIRPLILPSTVYHRQLTLQVGGLELELRQIDIHSQDSTVIVIPALKLLLAGDTLEDMLTYVTEPARLTDHLRGLATLSQWPFDWILPNHGRFDVIAAGGYQRNLLTATQRYIERLLAMAEQPGLADVPLSEFAAAALATGAIDYFVPYEAVHRNNVRQVLAAMAERRR
jgi:glyoxylase-like metal-dependent hydrolase (beta-lactamase superfamily II)